MDTQLKIHSYNTIILDIDGVVLDSNFAKEYNISIAASAYTDNETAKGFVNYFSSLNGVPREKKIYAYFEDKIIAESILLKYNQLNQESLFNVSLTSGVGEFLKCVYGKKEIIALSGGDEKEVNQILKHKDVLKYFTKVLGGPATKEENINKFEPLHPCVYIGDSKVDYDVAVMLDAEFVFMYGYTQFWEWESFFKNIPSVPSVKDFNELSLMLLN